MILKNYLHRLQFDIVLSVYVKKEKLRKCVSFERNRNSSDLSVVVIYSIVALRTCVLACAST